MERRAEISLLKLPSFHPCCFGCVNSGGPLFHFNRGHRADTRGLLSHTQSNHSLTDNVAHKVRKNEEEGRLERRLSGSVSLTTRLQRRKSRPQHLKMAQRRCHNFHSKSLIRADWNTHTRMQTHTHKLLLNRARQMSSTAAVT